MMKATCVSIKVLEEPHSVSLLVTKPRNTHSVVEELILPAMTVRAKIMSDKKAGKALKKA